MTKVLAIDVGGTKLSYAIINEKGEFLCEVKKTSTPKNIDELVQIFKNIIAENENDIDITAFATAGAVNIENTKVGNKLKRKRNLQQVMRESFFYGANRFGNNFIA